MSAWLEAFIEVSGYSEAFLAEVVARRGNWERDLGLDATKRQRAIRRLPLTAATLAREQGLAAEQGISSWISVLGEPELSEHLNATRRAAAVANAAEIPGESEAGRVFDPADFTEERIRAVLLEVVVRKTGYESGLVRWEADLERDLGIDSVKQAQILGELRKKYPLEFRQGLRLRDFPTLNHWVALTQQSLRALGESDSLEVSARVAGVECFEVGLVPIPKGGSTCESPVLCLIFFTP